jgi:hypothetical protein
MRRRQKFLWLSRLILACIMVTAAFFRRSFFLCNDDERDRQKFHYFKFKKFCLLQEDAEVARKHHDLKWRGHRPPRPVFCNSVGHARNETEVMMLLYLLLLPLPLFFLGGGVRHNCLLFCKTDFLLLTNPRRRIFGKV